MGYIRCSGVSALPLYSLLSDRKIDWHRKSTGSHPHGQPLLLSTAHLNRQRSLTRMTNGAHIPSRDLPLDRIIIPLSSTEVHWQLS